MGFIDWLFYSIEVTRRLTNSYYIIMAIITLIAVILMVRLRFKRFSINLWLISGLICLFWELYLYTTGARHYNFAPAFELSYHALTEAGPGLIIMILFAHKIKFVDLSEYSDNFKIGSSAPESLNPDARKKIKIHKPNLILKQKEASSEITSESTLTKSSEEEIDSKSDDDLDDEE